MRWYKHLPQFTKKHAINDKSAPHYLGRRAHGLTPRKPPAPSVLASAEKRKALYRNGRRS